MNRKVTSLISLISLVDGQIKFDRNNVEATIDSLARDIRLSSLPVCDYLVVKGMQSWRTTPLNIQKAAICKQYYRTYGVVPDNASISSFAELHAPKEVEAFKEGRKSLEQALWKFCPKEVVPGYLERFDKEHEEELLRFLRTCGK